MFANVMRCQLLKRDHPNFIILLLRVWYFLQVSLHGGMKEEAGRIFEEKWYQEKRKDINIFFSPLDME